MAGVFSFRWQELKMAICTCLLIHMNEILNASEKILQKTSVLDGWQLFHLLWQWLQMLHTHFDEQ